MSKNAISLPHQTPEPPLPHALCEDLQELYKNHPLACFFDIPQNDTTRPVQLLFRTVILNALYDGLKGQKEAKHWLLTPSADMEEVCDFAHLSPSWVRRISREILNNQHPMPAYRIWRYLWADLEQKGS